MSEMNEKSGLWNVPYWGSGIGFCSKCGKPSPFGMNSHRRGYDFCPRCGTNMYPELEEEIEIHQVEYTDEQLGREK